MSNNSMYGTCEVPDGEIPELDTALKMCRMLGLHYEIKQQDEYWSVRLETAHESPADFYADHRRPEQFGFMLRKSYGVICIRDKKELAFAVMQSISMAFSALRDSCGHWRRIAGTHPDYKMWPQFRQPEPAESKEQLDPLQKPDAISECKNA